MRQVSLRQQFGATSAAVFDCTDMAALAVVVQNNTAGALTISVVQLFGDVNIITANQINIPANASQLIYYTRSNPGGQSPITPALGAFASLFILSQEITVLVNGGPTLPIQAVAYYDD